MSNEFGSNPNNTTPDFHRSNLANRENIQTALNSPSFDWKEIATVAEMLCHTLSVKSDLLFVDRSDRVKKLLDEKIIELLIPRLILHKVNLRLQDRFRLTEKGRELLKRAIKQEYFEVSQVIIEHASQNTSPTEDGFLTILREEKDKQDYKKNLERLMKN